MIIKKISKLKHELIVEFYGISFSSTNEFCLILEFMPNGNISDLLEKRSKDVKFIHKIQFSLDIAKALYFFFEKNYFLID